MHARSVLPVVLVLAVAAGLWRPVPAQTSVAAAESPHWSAIGEITYGSAAPGAAICTGTLVAPDLVLTAGHCLKAHGTDGAADPANVNFAPGWPTDRSADRHRGSSIVLSGRTGLDGDLALLVLDSPVPPDVAQPLSLVAGTALVQTLTFIGYGRATPDIRTQADCPVLGVKDSVIGLGCAAVSGNSGAPLLTLQDGTWRIAGVMVARARLSGPIAAYAIIPDAVMAARIAQR